MCLHPTVQAFGIVGLRHGIQILYDKAVLRWILIAPIILIIKLLNFKGA